MRMDSDWSNSSLISMTFKKKNVFLLLKEKLNNVLVRDRMRGMKMMILLIHLIVIERLLSPTLLMMGIMIAIDPEEGEDTWLEILWKD